MISRYYLGPSGVFRSRFWWRMVLTLLWIAVSAFELVVTASSPRMHLLSYFWAAVLVFWVTMGALGIRLYLGLKRP